MVTKKMNNRHKGRCLRGFFLTAFFLAVSTRVAQSQELTGQQIDSIKDDGLTFLMQNKYFDKNGDRKKYLQQVFYYELAKAEQLGKSNSGIYIFTITSSHTDKFLFILNKRKWKYYRLDRIREILNGISSFATENDISEEAVFEYIDGFVTAYKSNQSLKEGNK